MPRTPRSPRVGDNGNGLAQRELQQTLVREARPGRCRAQPPVSSWPLKGTSTGSSHELRDQQRGDEARKATEGATESDTGQPPGARITPSALNPPIGTWAPPARHSA